MITPADCREADGAQLAAMGEAAGAQLAAMGEAAAAAQTETERQGPLKKMNPQFTLKSLPVRA